MCNKHIRQRRRFKLIQQLMSNVRGLPGSFIEFGVFKGDTLVKIAEGAQRQNRRCYAVDSFKGMSKPTGRNGKRGKVKYPKGRFNVGGSVRLRKQLVKLGLGSIVTVCEGFIPQVFEKMPSRLRFVFAHLDLDQYQPTWDSLTWVWPKMIDGGIVAVHDYQHKLSILCSGAVKDFLEQRKLNRTGIKGKYIWLTKKETEL